MGVFALDERFVGIPVQIALAGVIVPIHRAGDVGVVVAVVGGLLVLDRTRGVERLDPVVAPFEVGAVAGFVARAPDDDRRVVEIPVYHALVPVEVSLGKVGIPGQILRLVVVEVAVRLDVGLVDDVESVAVAEIVPDGGVGVVTRADGIDVEAFHLADVADHLLAGHVITRVGLHFVPVDAFDEDRFAVDQQLPAADLDLAESDREGGRLDH